MVIVRAAAASCRPVAHQKACYAAAPAAAKETAATAYGASRSPGPAVHPSRRGGASPVNSSSSDTPVQVQVAAGHAPDRSTVAHAFSLFTTIIARAPPAAATKPCAKSAAFDEFVCTSASPWLVVSRRSFTTQ